MSRRKSKDVGAAQRKLICGLAVRVLNPRLFRVDSTFAGVRFRWSQISTRAVSNVRSPQLLPWRRAGLAVLHRLSNRLVLTAILQSTVWTTRTVFERG
jgi:hypothetical protein